LDILVEGDASLLNIYHVIEVTAPSGRKSMSKAPKLLPLSMVSKRRRISLKHSAWIKFGSPLFSPDAGKKVEDLGK